MAANINMVAANTEHAFDLGRSTEPTAAPEQPCVAYGFLLAFVFLLYLSIPIVMPSLEVFHPAKLMGGAAIAALLVETALGRRQLTLALPEGGMLLAFLGVTMLSCVTALWPGLAAQVVADLAKMILVYFFVANCAASVPGLRGAMWTMVIGGLVPAVAVLRNYLHGNIVEGRTAWVGIFANPNDLAYSLVILVPLAASLAVGAGWIARAALLGMISLFAAGTFVTFSRGGLIGLAAVIVLYALKQRNLVTWILIAVMVSAGMYLGARSWTRSENFSDVQDDATFQLRLATSQAGLAMFVDHPILGVGAGCSVVAWPLYAPPGVRTRNALITHNAFIQALSETGILGFVTFFLFIGYGIWGAHKLARKGRDLENGERVDDLAAGLEVALVGFAVCGLSAGIMITWFPYILVGMVSAARRIQVTS